jgi:tRNA(His) guanylyltransferase
MAYKDEFGDRLKFQEQLEAGRAADKSLPLMARIDGKCFSSFTRGLERPYDQGLSNLMVETTKHIVRHSQAVLAYTQSDEISLYWDLSRTGKADTEFWFGGKYQKIVSVLASMAGSFFSANCPIFLPRSHWPTESGNYPTFDARVWNVPDTEAVADNFLWRVQDCSKNSVSMVARHYFSHKELQDKSCREMKNMLKDIGQPWEDLPHRYKHGRFIKRNSTVKEPGDPCFDNLPANRRPTEPVVRTQVELEQPAFHDLYRDFICKST